MTEKLFTVQRIYKGMDNGVKYYDWCVMKDNTVILRLSTRMDCKDVVEVNRNIEEQYDRITKQIIQLKLSIGTLTEEINTLHETIQTLQVKQ